MKKLLNVYAILLSALFGQVEEASAQDYLNLEFAFSAGVGNVRVDNSILDANYERTYAAKIGYGYTFPNRFSVGALAMYDYFSESGFLIFGPEIRYVLAKSGDFKPFVSGVLGYGSNLGNKDRSGGLFYYPSLGTTIRLNEHGNLLLSIGLKHQRFSEEEKVMLTEGTTETLTNDYKLNFLTLSVGVQF
jgi:hypothetical protein